MPSSLLFALGRGVLVPDKHGVGRPELLLPLWFARPLGPLVCGLLGSEALCVLFPLDGDGLNTLGKRRDLFFVLYLRVSRVDGIGIFFVNK